ncbi:MAG TPA: hypothetical protein VJ140_10125, partial [Actinomycetota bacterium]|nr:hypothetical protein [Actinomycetota bacterium]
MSGNPGGRPKQETEFREAARGHAADLLPVVAQRAMEAESRPADVMAFEAICRAGGYTARAAELHVDLAA